MLWITMLWNWVVSFTVGESDDSHYVDPDG